MVRTLRRQSTAGRSADAFFKHARAEWRGRVGRRVQIFLLVPVALCYVAQVAWGGDLVSWFLGLAAGMFGAVWVWFWDSPPQHIENWRTGAEGERRTAKALAPMARSGWTVAHDLEGPRGNYDHVLVGPAGVFLVNTKKLSGVVTIRDDTVRLDRPDNPRATCELPHLARSVRGEAATLSEALHQHTGRRVWVQAVIVLWADFRDEVVDGDRVTFVAGSRLPSWLSARPVRLSRAEVADFADAVSALPPAT